MLRKVLAAGCLVAVAAAVGRPAHASDDDLLAAPTAPASIRAHQYSLAECLALAERNFPKLWAARARLAGVHAQLDEAKWTPWFQWSRRHEVRRRCHRCTGR